jgi:flagellar hook-length control protein FliK
VKAVAVPVHAPAAVRPAAAAQAAAVSGAAIDFAALLAALGTCADGDVAALAAEPTADAAANDPATDAVTDAAPDVGADAATLALLLPELPAQAPLPTTVEPPALPTDAPVTSAWPAGAAAPAGMLASPMRGAVDAMRGLATAAASALAAELAPKHDAAWHVPGQDAPLAQRPTADTPPFARRSDAGDVPPVDAAAIPRGAAAHDALPSAAAERAAAAELRGAVDALPQAASPVASAAHALHAAPALAPPPQSAAAPAFTIAAPLAGPDFAPALAAQVSLLARDGVQQAELRLNPAEMGPIAVRIDIGDAATAVVHFVADAAATREAIEHGLPELAGALREAGLTLVGGGVSEHAAQRGRRDGEPAPDGSARGHADDAADGDAPPPATLPQRRRGVVDLVA